MGKKCGDGPKCTTTSGKNDKAIGFVSTELVFGIMVDK